MGKFYPGVVPGVVYTAISEKVVGKQHKRARDNPER